MIARSARFTSSFAMHIQSRMGVDMSCFGGCGRRFRSAVRHSVMRVRSTSDPVIARQCPVATCSRSAVTSQPTHVTCFVQLQQPSASLCRPMRNPLAMPHTPPSPSLTVYVLRVADLSFSRSSCSSSVCRLRGGRACPVRVTTSVHVVPVRPASIPLRAVTCSCCSTHRCVPFIVAA